MKIQELNVYMVLFNKDRILLLKRENGFWEFPGGGVDWGEDPRDAAIRETREETGLTAHDASFVMITSATYPKGEDEKHSVYIVYKGQTDGLDVRMSSEHVEHRWLGLSEARFMKMAMNAEGVLDYL
ncbi:MAG: NUDIX hydrolase [Candidatus ainarchaeum sp.]|nr:NUDIX hydrolase [Candidatus ainarchaeum sp.]